MQADQIVRANRAAVALPGAASVREFAAREFPREDYHWVVASARPRPAPTARRTFGWARLLWFRRSPGKAELDHDTTPEPAPA